MNSFPPELVYVLVITLVLSVLVLTRRKKAEPSNLPPLCGPSWYTNIAKITCIEGTESVRHIFDICNNNKDRCKTGLGAVFRLSMIGASHFVVVADYQLARIIMGGSKELGVMESEKTPIGRAFDLYKGLGSIFSDLTCDEGRKAARKFIAPSFSLTNLKYTFGIIFQSLEVFGDILSESERKGKPLDLNEAMIRLTFDSITESAFGVNYHTQKTPHHSDDEVMAGNKTEESEGEKYLRVTEKRLMEGFRRTLNPLRPYMFWSSASKKFESANKTVETIIQNIIQSYKESHPNGFSEDMSIMGHLMRHEYSDERRRIADINTFIVAGHETTSHSLTMMFVCVCQHPEVKRKLQMELDAAIPGDSRHDATLFPSASELQSLPYLSMCIKEAMRLYPTVGAGSKRCTIDDIDYDGMHIPAGSVCNLHYYSMFRPHWLPRAEEYLPERWSEDSPDAKNLKEMFMPFAVGSRNCIGQNLAKVELVMIAAYVLRFFDLELTADPKYMTFLTMKATDVWVNVISRP